MHKVPVDSHRFDFYAGDTEYTVSRMPDSGINYLNILGSVPGILDLYTSDSRECDVMRCKKLIVEHQYQCAYLGQMITQFDVIGDGNSS